MIRAPICSCCFGRSDPPTIPTTIFWRRFCRNCFISGDASYVVVRHVTAIMRVETSRGSVSVPSTSNSAMIRVFLDIAIVLRWNWIVDTVQNKNVVKPSAKDTNLLEFIIDPGPRNRKRTKYSPQLMFTWCPLSSWTVSITWPLHFDHKITSDHCWRRNEKCFATHINLDFFQSCIRLGNIKFWITIIISKLFRCRSKPLQIWDKQVRNGHIKRITDPDIQSSVLEIMGTNVSTTYVTCPADSKKVLGIKLPFLVMIIKNVRDDSSMYLHQSSQLFSSFASILLLKWWSWMTRMFVVDFAPQIIRSAIFCPHHSI